MDTNAFHAMIRFGLGRRGAEALPADPRGWLAGQLDGPDPALAAPAHTLSEGLHALRDGTKLKTPGRRLPIREMYLADTRSAIDTLLTTSSPFRERLVWFWANHFTVSIKKPLCAALVNPYIREAIRPHVTGRFADMVLAVMRHPGMLFYLDNAASVGPDSLAGRRNKRGLNENLARECLELHTVTPAAGYTQADVTAFARVLTGWSINADAEDAGFVFRAGAHEPGEQIVMGQRYSGGEAAGVAALNWLASHPAATRNVATKLVRHFVADTPPPDAVRRVDEVLRRTKGDLKAAMLVVLDLPAAWRPLTKLRTPFDYAVAVLRGLDLAPERRPDVIAVLALLGQPIHEAPLPNGWPDTAPDWAGPETMLRRVDWAYLSSARATGMDPVALADNSLGPLLPADTRAQIARAGAQREAVTLLLASPEFQRR